MSITITLSGHTSELTASYMPPIDLPRKNDGKDWYVGLIDFHTFYSIPNIDYSNNVIGIGPYTIILPEGTYEIKEIFDYLNQQVQEKEPDEDEIISLQGNLNTLQCAIKSKYDIDFTHKNSLGSVLGYRPKVLKAGKLHYSDLPVDLVKVHDIRIECNVATKSFINERPAHLIYAFCPDVEPGYRLIQRPSKIIYYPLTTDSISELRVRIVDQQGKLCNFRGEELTLRLNLVYQ